MVIDEVELQMHHQLEKLYRSTRSGRDFQKEIVKAAEAFTAVGYKHIEAGTKLSEDCSKYGVENASDEILAKAASIYGDARKHVLEPLRAMITGSPLEDARHLAQRYSRMRQEAEAQAAEVSRRQARVRESPIPENVAKLHAAELECRKSKQIWQYLMVSEKQRKEAAPPVTPLNHTSEKTKYFLAEVMHAFDAASEKELSLAVGDYVVVRKVSPSGWSEGECQGRAGWFPTAYVEKRQRIPTNYTATEVY
ncbi:UNVERIFIED_CONTAM: SH3 domain-containing protein 3 [Sesamum radiatum]|uniref:SH3 domain-containing protein 3 n=1 Tax=Sesamum radiatum TaxID=300843 RepID=A0AAW2T0N5_SESRA